MRLDRLTETPAPPAGLEPRELKTEAKGGKITFTYHPARAHDETGTSTDRLERSLLGWDLQDDAGNPVPLNADAIHALAPEVKDALLAAIDHPRKAAAGAVADEKPKEEERPRARAGAEEKKKDD